MSTLSILEQKAYLSIILKDNGIWSHLAYTDHNASREYILSDFTDLTPLRYRLDDDVFNKNFWYEYFDSLENIFNWDIVDRDKDSVFTFRNFVKEGDGITGIRVLIDDNQKFFDKIFASVRDFSNDIALRVIDDLYVQKMLEGLIEKSEYDDLIYVDMDLMDFSVFRVQKIYDRKLKQNRKVFSKSKIHWKDELSLIDSVKDSRFKAFLATDLSSTEISNFWANFVLNRILYSEDPNLLDILRTYSIIQNHSIFRDNRAKLENFGLLKGESALIVSGYIPSILGKSKTLLTLIDGLELMGSFDCYWDLDMKLLAYGNSYIAGSKAIDIILTRKEVFSQTSRVIIPEIRSIRKNKLILSGKAESLGSVANEFFAMASEYVFIPFPKHTEKLLIQGEFQKGVVIYPNNGKELSLVSSPEVKTYQSLVVDARLRPIVYGPDSYANKLKLQSWIK